MSALPSAKPATCYIQFSQRRPRTRRNSASLFVTSVTPRLTARPQIADRMPAETAEDVLGALVDDVNADVGVEQIFHLNRARFCCAFGCSRCILDMKTFAGIHRYIAMVCLRPPLNQNVFVIPTEIQRADSGSRSGLPLPINRQLDRCL